MLGTHGQFGRRKNEFERDNRFREGGWRFVPDIPSTNLISKQKVAVSSHRFVREPHAPPTRCMKANFHVIEVVSTREVDIPGLGRPKFPGIRRQAIWMTDCKANRSLPKGKSDYPIGNRLQTLMADAWYGARELNPAAQVIYLVPAMYKSGLHTSAAPRRTACGQRRIYLVRPEHLHAGGRARACDRIKPPMVGTSDVTPIGIEAARPLR